jgi:hypothetical protein
LFRRLDRREDDFLAVTERCVYGDRDSHGRAPPGQPELLTPRARAAFILTRTSLEARRQAEVHAVGRLVWEAFRQGRPTPTSLASHVLPWLVPDRARFEILARLGRRAKRGRPA